MKKVLCSFLILLFTTTLISCTNDENDSTDIKVDANITKKIQYIDIEIDETYDISSLLDEFKGIEVEFEDSSLVNYSNGVITGLKEGISRMFLSHDGKKQVIRLEVHKPGDLDTSFTFDEYRLAGKNIVAFGDSGTANSTVNGADTYYNLFAKHFKMVEGGNFAIGGTTATYGYEGSNIYKEYNETKYYGGPQRIIEVYNEGKLDNVDYVILSYVGNDRYFQVPIENENPIEYDVDIKNADTLDANVYASAHSFKDSYRHMIKTLRQINPRVRIILLNFHYSEFDYYTYARYGSKYTSNDYRNAEREIADEMKVKYLSSYQHTRNYFDYTISGGGLYYTDCVHMSVYGHEKYADYLINGGAEWYIVGNMNDWKNDVDWEFARNVRKKTFYIKLEEGSIFKIQNRDGSVVIDANNDAVKKQSGLTDDGNGNIKVTETKTYTFILDGSNKLTIKEENPKMVFAYFRGTDTPSFIDVERNKKGLYEQNIRFSKGHSVTIFFEGRHMTPENTKFIGSFKDQNDATDTKDLYRNANASFRYYSSYDGNVRYKFSYNPETNTLTISTD